MYQHLRVIPIVAQNASRGHNHAYMTSLSSPGRKLQNQNSVNLPSTVSLPPLCDVITNVGFESTAAAAKVPDDDFIAQRMLTTSGQRFDGGSTQLRLG